MCGIVGYIGEHSQPANLIIEYLKRLEYRGYDSWGLASITANKSLLFMKDVGYVKDANMNHVNILNHDACCVIGHTRWATHGKVNVSNAHPQLSSDFKIAVVHNGVIENYVELKSELEQFDYHFESETDTEVIPNLLQQEYKICGNFKKALISTVNILEGAYGIVATHIDEPNKLYVAKMSSPIIICDAHDGKMIISDSNVVDSNKAIILGDGEIAEVTAMSCKIFNAQAQKITRKSVVLNNPVYSKSTGDHDSFMHKEIYEQPKAIAEAIKGRLVAGQVVLEATRNLRSIKRIKILACGSSWCAALIGKIYLENISRIPTEVEYASEFRYRNPIVEPNTLAIAISQSGETADTLSAICEAKCRGAKTLGIINTVNSAISRECDGGIFLRAGPEYGVAATKSFVNQVVSLLLLSVSLAQDRKISLPDSMIDSINILPDMVEHVLKCEEKTEQIAKHYSGNDNFLYIGRLLEYPIALEGALKLKEISYVHAEGMPAAELKHGAIALITEDMPTVVVHSQLTTLKKVVSNVQEIKARGGKIISISNNDELLSMSDHFIKLPDCLNDYVCPILSVIPLQLLAYHVAKIRGCNVDKPRNLAKCVTVE
jgi:glucosamine--fructose-6-phosphate aminotransferase (isomerizing)